MNQPALALLLNGALLVSVAGLIAGCGGRQLEEHGVGSGSAEAGAIDAGTDADRRVGFCDSVGRPDGSVPPCGYDVELLGDLKTCFPVSGIGSPEVCRRLCGGGTSICQRDTAGGGALLKCGNHC